MSKVAVIYWSQTGNTEAMANAVADGAQEKGAEVTVMTCAEATVDGYDAVALGCPAMGAEELEDSEFQPMYDDIKDSLVGKKVALFGSYGWGDGEWMRTWEEDIRDAGVELAAECLIINETPDDEGIEQCKALGAALA